ncbi:MAG: precorrin-6y C5,15-methyltransferase (decarboxylating) subunit CbiE [Odoribacter sp.]|nr:precorrin-6y C5,15-methyltransferase (decarboxylating) subunit CbiE [Odoribacter sp.]
MGKFYIIGIDDSGSPEFGQEVKRVIAAHGVFSGGKRHYGLVRGYLPPHHVWIDISVPLDAVFERYSQYPEIVVFASGDPLFFGFANTVKNRLPEAEIRVFPAFNSLQTLAHRLVLSYHDMHIVSLTGRPWHEFDRALIEGKEKIGILTDRQHTPAAIAGRMLEYGYSNYRMIVGEMLGNADERVCVLELPEAVRREFEVPNCLILEKTNRRGRLFGIPENRFHLLDGRTKMITKMPVRLLTLSMLGLHNRCSFWDIGFCTGSISIEAKLQFPHLQVTSFEIREEGRSLMEQNSRLFGVPGITTVIGDFTSTDLSPYPCPDAVFIGGHGGKLEKILTILAGVMISGGVVVFNSVSAESLALFQQAAATTGFRILQSSLLAVDEHNPITVIAAALG